MIRIGVILPTRGLVYTSVMDATLGNLEGFAHKIYFSKDLVIPDSQNYLVEKALQDKEITHLLFIEDDTVIPENGLRDMLAENAAIACIDYGVAGWSCVTRDKNTNEALWCGLGCTLIRREVFEALKKPYFRSDKALLLNFWPEIRWIDAGEQAYGLQDIWFCMQARKKGFKVTQVYGECKHLQIDQLGKREINKGLHQISQKPEISKHNTI